MLRISDYDFVLPKKLIAQKPARPRDSAKLLLVNRKKADLQHAHISDLPAVLKKGDLVVFNNSCVIPARLFVKKETGGKVELLLVRHIQKSQWEALVGGRNVLPGMTLIASPKVRVRVLRITQSGTRIVDFSVPPSRMMHFLKMFGNTPTPPYITRKARAKEYQTIFADPSKPGSAAAPTAGLHFTKKLLRNMRSQGIELAYVTLHVGLGTFAPLTKANIANRSLHPEYAEISDATRKKILQAKKAGRRVIAVGTTTVRALEGLLGPHMQKKGALHGWLTLFISPGFRFRIIDAMLTNFHLPKSSLLMLVSAFGGKKRIHNAYDLAVRKAYRFYSFGDAMLIL